MSDRHEKPGAKDILCSKLSWFCGACGKERTGQDIDDECPWCSVGEEGQERTTSERTCVLCGGIIPKSSYMLPYSGGLAHLACYTRLGAEVKEPEQPPEPSLEELNKRIVELEAAVEERNTAVRYWMMKKSQPPLTLKVALEFINDRIEFAAGMDERIANLEAAVRDLEEVRDE